MSEDRTQEPSKRRRLQARERGQVARSPELTGAAGLLAASILLGVWGDDLALALLGLVRETWSGDLGILDGPAGVVGRLRGAAWGVAGPLLGLLGGSMAAMVAAHQAQVGGLFVPGLIAPDLARLGGFGGEEGSGPGLAARAGRGAWSVVKAAVVVAVAAGVIRSDVAALARLGHLDPPALARASGSILRSAALAMALATLALGLVDFALQYRRIGAMMRLTPDEHREDIRAADGDPALRGRRIRQARALRGDAPELMAGARLAVTGPSGLIVILAGGPPPRRITVRSSADGATGARLRKAADAAGVPLLDAPDLARALARLRAPAVPPGLLAALGPGWPTDA